MMIKLFRWLFRIKKDIPNNWSFLEQLSGHECPYKKEDRDLMKRLRDPANATEAIIISKGGGIRRDMEISMRNPAYRAKMEKLHEDSRKLVQHLKDTKQWGGK